MSAPTTWLPRPTTPGPISLARALAIVQVVLGLFSSVMLGFLALLGLAWTTEDGGGPSALAIAYTAIFAVSLGVTIALACLTGSLRPGGVRVRSALTVVECGAVLTTLVLLATAGAEGSIGSLLVAPMLYAGCGVAVVVLINRPACRPWFLLGVPR